jgi:DNA-binding GntR family transcriptional regulator
MELSVQEHKKIIQAFRNNDGHTADLLVRKNAAYGGQVLLKNKNENKQSPKESGCV